MDMLLHPAWLWAAPAAIFIYYAAVWLKIGPEPELASVQILYEPPPGLSPATARYLTAGACDGRALAAAIAQLAARGCLEIRAQNGAYKLSRAASGAPENLAPEETAVRDILFEDGPEVSIQPGEGLLFTRCLLAILLQVQRQFERVFFTRNARYFVAGLLISLATWMTLALALGGGHTAKTAFLTWWLFLCVYMLGAIVFVMLIPSWRRGLRGLGGTRPISTGVVILAVSALLTVMLSRSLATHVSPAYPLALVTTMFVNFGWLPALRRRTARGRQAVIDVLGFRNFLEKVERDRLQRLSTAHDPREETPDLLPYAIALGIREPWGDHLTQAFAASSTPR